jgi:Flp pilus assembly protein TadG
MKSPMLTSTRPRRPGNVLVLFAILLTGLVGMVAFAIDTGYIALTKTQLQRTADAAAHAGSARLALAPGQAHDPAAVRAEVRRFVALNAPVMTVRDDDITLLRYDPLAPASRRASTDLSAGQPNAVQVTLRRDGLANGPLPLFFAPVIGNRTANVLAVATSYVQPARGLTPGSPLVPYVVDINWYLKAIGQAGATAPAYALRDAATVAADGALRAGADGKPEVLLFSSNKKAPGNFGSIDIGTASNGTPELERQILYGPTWSDFQSADFRHLVAADGALYAPFSITGDTGISNGVKDAFTAIIGRVRIAPLTSRVTGNGNNATYDIVGFAAMVVTAVDLTGNPKEVWAQPSAVVTSRATAGSGAQTPTNGVYLPPRLVITEPESLKNPRQP